MTPLREKKPSTDTNYDIEDLNSGDETDDEENPRKKIPFWAQGKQTDLRPHGCIGCNQNMIVFIQARR